MPRNSPRATGICSIGRRLPASGGFTLIELMVVVLIMGILAASVVLSVGVTGRDTELERESERMFSLMNYVREKAELQTREFGLYCHDTDYEFLTFDPRKQLWRAADEDDALRARELPEGLKLNLVVEGRPVVLKRKQEEQRALDKEEQEKADRERLPHVILFSNGDLTPFRLTVEREEAGRSISMASNDKGLIEAEPLKETRR